jgi:DnaJ-class molecular chaperone
MYDLAVPNNRVGVCEKCKGSGLYSWGGTVNGKPRFQGQCHSCQGHGTQTSTDIKRNHAYNRHKIRRLTT